MKLLSQIFASCILSIFGLFLCSPVFALNAETPNAILLSSNFSATCSSNIQCEVLSSGQYFCHSTGEGISNAGRSIHHIPVGKSGTDITPIFWNPSIQSQEVTREKLIVYIGPDTYLYPFVGIIKIQV